MRILYVENSPGDADPVRRELLKVAPHFRLEAVATQVGAMERLRRLDAEPLELILTDMHLPDGDGLKLLTHVRDSGLALAVVLIIGAGDEETAVAALKAGADDYVVKREGYLERLSLTLESALYHYRAGAHNRSRPLRVLYAEHNPDDADLTLRHFSKHASHIHLDVISTGPAVLTLLESGNKEDEYDALLLDYRLPGQDALELLKELRLARKSDIPIVLVTGQGSEEVALQAIKLGASSCVVKNPGYLYQLPGELENAVFRFELSRREQALRESQDTEHGRGEEAVNFQVRLLDSVEQAVIASDMDGVVIYWNQFAERLYGWSMDEAVGREVKSLLRHMDSQESAEEIWAILRQGQSWAGEFTVKHRDGHLLQVWVNDSPVFDARGNLVGVLGISHDITERKKEEAFREGQSRVLEMIAAGAPLADILMSLVLLIESQTEGMLCSVVLLDEDGEKVHYGAAPSLPEFYVKAIDGARIGPQAGSCGTAMYRGEPVVVTDILDDPLWKDWHELAMAAGLRACWSTPILSPQGRVLGSFAMYYRAPRGPSPAEKRLTDIAIHLAGIAIARQRAEEALRKSEQRLRLAQQAASVGTWEWNLQTGESVWSEMIWQLLGLEPDDTLVTVERFIEFIHPDDRDRALRKVNEVIAEGEEYKDEFRIVRRDRRVLWVSSKGRVIRAASGQPERMLGVNIDITERKLAEEALKESEDQVRIFVEHTPVAVAMFDREMRYIMTSRRWLKDNHLGEENLIGRSHYEVVPDLPERWKEGHRRCLAGNVERCEEDVFQRSDGSTDWVRWETRPWYTASGEVGGIIMFSEMITERKRAEDELLRLTVRLSTLQDEERRRIARELHDGTAQNLFAISLNLTKLQQHGSSLAAEQKRVLEECQALTEQSLQEIRTLSYLLHPPLLDQAGLVSALQWYVEGFIKRSGIHVDLLVLQDIGRLPSEIETALFRIVQESLTNIHRHSGSRTASIRLEKTPDEIMLQIKDQGRGMPLSDLLETADEISELGVGIPGMRQRLRQLGGRLEVGSNEQGTTIVAYVSLAERKGASA